MSVAVELEDIVDQMRLIHGRFRHGDGSLIIQPGDQARFNMLVMEARELIAEALGDSEYSFRIETDRLDGLRNYFQSQSHSSVANIMATIEVSIKRIRRREARPASASQVAVNPYVSDERLAELRGLSSPWDLRRLIRMCEEINSSFAAGNYLSVAMMLRAIADHVPPIFNATSFKQHVSQISGRSHKGSMEHLEQSLRNIADGVLHVQIRDKESIPSQSGVDFRQDLDALLSEIVRVLR